MQDTLEGTYLEVEDIKKEINSYRRLNICKLKKSDGKAI